MARQIVVNVIGDAKGFTSALDTAASHAGKFNSILTGIGQGIGMKVFDTIASAADRATDFIFGSIDAASGLQQSVGAVESVFGPASATIRRFGETAAQTMGLSKREVNEMASVAGAMLQSAGFSAEEAAKQYMTLQQRAADMAATFGGDTKSAMEAISSLMRGERDPIERYGVSIKQADINARLAAEGLDHLEGQARKQAEAQVALAMLMEQTANTEGQFARESDTLAGSQARAAAEFENAQAKLGQLLMPVAVAFFGFINDTAIPALFGLIDGMAPVISTISDGFGPVLEAVTGTIANLFSPAVNSVSAEVLPALGSAFDFITGTVVPALADVFTWVTTHIVPPLVSIFKAASSVLVNVLGVAFRTVVDVVRSNWPAISQIAGGVANAVEIAINIVSAVIKAVAPVITWLAQTIFPILGTAAGVLLNAIATAFGAIGNVWNSAKSVAVSVVNIISKAWSGLTGVFRTVWNGISGTVKSGANFLIGIINGLISAINRIQVHIPRIGLDVPGVGFVGVGPFNWNGLNLPRLPYLHQGGVVPGVPGSDVLAILQAGELVIPRMDARQSGDGWSGTRRLVVELRITSDGSMPNVDTNQLAEMVRSSDFVRAIEHAAEAA